RAHQRRRGERAEAGGEQCAAARRRRHAHACVRRTASGRAAAGVAPRLALRRAFGRAFVVPVTCCMLPSPLVLMPSSLVPAEHRLSSESEKMLTSRPRENP
ncbi:hypothetical protein, partial [Burkholderia ambifaria]|uniref:hypothetical protein n=1 Tax=Burkholderia ambifaria TaxID=152480 RepID=UPI001E3D139E